MGRHNYFQFKQFAVVQEKSAMKVGTDGVLLGAWADVSGACKILDIGTGTGLIALMAAQRSPAEITGVEIDPNAFGEATFNAAQSPWAHRIRLIHLPFQEFAKHHEAEYDLIITNPPFFENDKRPPDKSRSAAKHTVTLTYEELLHGIRNILSPSGKISVILPVSQAIRFRKMALLEKIYLSKLTVVKPTPEKTPHRWLMEYRTDKGFPQVTELIIAGKTHHEFTDDYKNLTKDFYLAF